MERTHPWMNLAAGASAGAAESFITYVGANTAEAHFQPTEFVKTVNQLGGKTNRLGPIGVIRETLRLKGVAGFYAGCGPVMAGNALKAGTRFLSYETIRNALRDENGNLSTASNIMAGMGAGCIESIVAVTPSEAIKTRLIEANLSRGGRSSVAVIGTILRTERITALYRGLVPTILKQSANSAVRFTSYQVMKDHLQARSGGKIGNGAIMAIGGLAGVITVYCTMPFDVVKTRMQQGATSYTSTGECFVKMIKEEGITAFWRGSSPRVARLLVSGTVTFVIYENVLKGLQTMV